MVDNMKEPHVTCESSMSFEIVFMKKMLDHMDEITLKMRALEAENTDLRDNFMKKEEEHENLKV